MLAAARLKVLSLKAAVLLARSVFCALVLLDLLLVAYIGALLFDGGPASVIAWIAHAGGSRHGSGFLQFALACGFLAAITLTMYRLQAWLSLRSLVVEIVEGITSRMIAAMSAEEVPDSVSRELTNELRLELHANLSQLVRLKSRAAHWELANTTLRIFGRRRASEHRQVIEKVRVAVFLEVANTTMFTFGARHAPEHRKVIEKGRKEWLRQAASDIPAYRAA
jgi:hypothetical protein